MDVMLERWDWSNVLGLDDDEHYKQDSAPIPSILHSYL